MNAASSAPRLHFLDAFLAPLRPYLEESGVSEVSLNRPGEVWIDREGSEGMTRIEIPELTEERIWSLARQVASKSHQRVSNEEPLLSATLPTGERIQFAMPPISPKGAFSIRKQSVRNLRIEDYTETGGLRGTRVQRRGVGDAHESPGEDAIAELLRTLVHDKKTVLISGGTSSGKTTLLNALSCEIPAQERLVTIEDVYELELPHENRTALRASKGDQGDAAVSIQDLLEASLRLRPERILLGELRGAEAYTFLRAVNTGHPGSLSTLHANSPQRAMEQLVLMVLQARMGLQREEILEYLHSVLDAGIQISRQSSGQRVISEIYLTQA